MLSINDFLLVFDPYMDDEKVCISDNNRCPLEAALFHACIDLSDIIDVSLMELPSSSAKDLEIDT
jgi:hypothetical protein